MLKIANHELLAAALIGYQHQLEQIDAKIAGIRAQLGHAPASPASPAAASGPRPKRHISAEGRARIAAAQRARWAKSRKKAKGAAR